MASARPPGLFQTTEAFTAQLRATRPSVRVLREEATAVAVRRGLVGQALADVSLAVSEAAANVITYGSRRPDATITLTVAFEDGEMQMVVSGQAPLRSADEPAGGGFGLAVIAAVAKRMRVLSGPTGTSIRMEFACPRRANHASLVRLAHLGPA